ncbi:MAG TPA: tetratricopeptide repeat protein [Phycisphaerales bacterium]|nr:tetratricopeptide repeat protein [Phycisphaerales bacterium]
MFDRPLKLDVRKLLFISISLCVLVLIVYGRTSSHEFVDYDDTQYVVQNPDVNHGITIAGLEYAFTDTRLANWHPLTFLSHMLDCQLFGLEHPGGHHLVNVLLHACNSVLVLLVLRLFTGSVWRSAFVAAIFAVHPLHVESVAWVAERKDVLSTLFALLTLVGYWWHLQTPSARRYALMLLAFALSLMSKAMFVTLPFAMLLLDYWPLRRFGWKKVESSTQRSFAHCVIEKIPLVAMAAAVSAVAMITQRSAGAAMSVDDLPMSDRLMNTVFGYAIYLRQFIWPVDLAVFYPYQQGRSVQDLLINAALIVVITIASLVLIRRRPSLFVGWCFYLGTLVPVIGLVQIGAQAHADRYMYAPMLGLLIAILWLMPGTFSASRAWLQPALTLVGFALIAAATVGAWRQVGYWKDSRTLYDHTLAITTNNHIIQNNIGILDQQAGRLPEAMARFQEAARIKPSYVDAWCNMGINNIFTARKESAQGHTQAAQQHLQEALGFLKKALELSPKFASAHASLGEAYFQLGYIGQAESEFSLAIQYDPNLTAAIINLGLVRSTQGRFDDAIKLYQQGLEKGNQDAMTYYLIGIANMKRQDCRSAIPAFESAIQRNAGLVDAYVDYATALAACGRFPEAAQQINMALSKDPNNQRAKGIKQALDQQLRSSPH